MADPEALAGAEKIGEMIARRGYQLICGGYGGVMEAACRGAKSASGTTIGILLGNNRYEANDFIDMPIATGMGIARNSIIAHSADAAIAISGSFGTLSEIAFFLQLEKPVVTLLCPWQIAGTIPANTPAEALKMIEERIWAKNA